MDCNRFGIGHSLEILRTVGSNVSEICIRKLGIKKVEGGMPCMKNKGLIDVSYAVGESLNVLEHFWIFTCFPVTNLTQHLGVNLRCMHLIRGFIVNL